MRPLFSVIVPVYNAGSFVFDVMSCLDRQTYKNFEAVFVDDGSTDKTYELMESIVGQRSQFRIYRQQNKGPLMARRFALDHAKGLYALFLDVDDLLREDALETIASVIERTGADIISFPFSRSLDFSQAYGARLKEGIYDSDRYMQVKQLVCGGAFNSLWGKAVKLSCIDIDASYESYVGMMHGEDLFQLLPIIDNASSFVQLSEALYFYRDSSESSTSCFRERQLLDIVIVNRRLLSFARKWGNACVEAAVHGEVNQYLYLMQIVENGSLAVGKKNNVFLAIKSVMAEEHVFDRASSTRQRFDICIILYLLETNRFLAARRMVRTIEKVKSILGHVKKR